MKTCKTCQVEKNENCFYVGRAVCKDCVHIQQRNYDNQQNIKNRKKQYRQDNSETNIAYQQQYRRDNKEEIAQKDAKRHQENKESRNKQQRDHYAKEEIKQQRKQYRNEHSEEIKMREKQYQAKETTKKRRNTNRAQRRKNDPIFRLRIDVSSAINHALNGTKNNLSCMDHLSYTIEQLKAHLESRFESWMTWNNHGKYNSRTYDELNSDTWTWHIDHIIPQSLLPYTSMKDDNFQKCWALSNLQPLKAIDNLKKGKKVIQ